MTRRPLRTRLNLTFARILGTSHTPSDIAHATTIGEGERRYRALFERSRDAIWSVDHAGVITDANPAAAELLGYSLDDLVGLDTAILMANPDDRRRFRNEIAVDGTVKDFELQLRRKDGTVVDCIETFSVVEGDGGQVLGYQGIVRDITHLKRTQSALEEAIANLKRSNEELEQFAYVASHDLQEPLRMVSSYTQLLEKRYGDALDEKAKGFIAYAVDGARRMQNLINDLLAYSRVQTRGGAFRKLDLNVALGQARANLAATIGEAQALVTHDELPVVTADEAQLVSVFQNLIGNAVKFRREETPRVHVSATAHDGGVEIAVRDNGIGIRGDFEDRVFVIFQRLHGRSEYPGTGIGLALCKRIVERHGGRIWFESAEGEGTTFRFTLPIRESEMDNE